MSREIYLQHMENRIPYFAYGSNMSKQRITERIGDVKTLCTGYIKDYTLDFSKIGVDNSGKAHIRPSKGDVVYGVIYEIDLGDLMELDAYEGLGFGYLRKEYLINTNEGNKTAIAYFAQEDYRRQGLLPSQDYLSYLVEGAVENSFPQEYIEKLKKEQVQDD